jgi:hypothetical protein
MEGALEVERLALRELFNWGPWRICRKGSGDRHLSIGALLGNLEGVLFTRDFERWMKEALEVEPLSL